MSTIIQSLEQRQLRTDIPRFKAGDTVAVHFKVIEGARQRIQVFEGIVIKRQGRASARRSRCANSPPASASSARSRSTRRNRQDRRQGDRRRQPREAVLPARARRQEGARPRDPPGLAPREARNARDGLDGVGVSGSSSWRSSLHAGARRRVSRARGRRCRHICGRSRLRRLTASPTSIARAAAGTPTSRRCERNGTSASRACGRAATAISSGGRSPRRLRRSSLSSGAVQVACSRPGENRHESGRKLGRFGRAGRYPRRVPVLPGQRLLRFDRRLGVRFVAGPTRRDAGRSLAPSSSPVSCSTTRRSVATGSGRWPSSTTRSRWRRPIVEELFQAVIGVRGAISVRVIPAGEIDRAGLHKSNLGGLRAVLADLHPRADACLVDGFRLGPSAPPHRAVVDGDTKSAAIAAASIVAKVVRDRVMRRIDAMYPRYGFSSHVGYITPGHTLAVRVPRAVRATPAIVQREGVRRRIRARGRCVNSGERRAARHYRLRGWRIMAPTCASVGTSSTWSSAGGER